MKNKNGYSSIRNVNTSINGFSLVEITVSIAICTLSLIAIVALVPSAVNTQKLSNDASVGALIVRQIISDGRQSDFDELIASQKTTYRYFDNEGFDVQRGKQVFTAEIVLNPLVDVAGPGSSRVNLNDLARLRVRVARNQLGRITNDSAVFSATNPIVHSAVAYIGRKESKVK